MGMINEQLETMWNERAVIYIELLSWNLPEQTLEPTCTNWGNLKIPVMTVKIWAQHLPQMKQEPSLLGHHVLLKDLS